jgi:pyruvate,orthophosphate dikinase
MAVKYIYAFGGGTADGRGDQKALLGGKGAGLAEMSRLGIPVPPGYTLTTDVCTYFQEHDGRYPPGLERELAEHLRQLEARTGQRFGDAANPLLVSVRSGAPMSMPGMMDTVLNLGLTQALVDAWIERGADARFVLDAWRRLLTMYGDVVLGVEHAGFEQILAAARAKHGAASDNELPPAALAGVAKQFKRLIAEHGRPFPEDPREQLAGAIGAVFSSWNNRRAREYRRINGISDRLGTAVNVQAMVFGNRGSDCATGVAFTRNPATGEARVYGEYLVNAQGEDVVAGIRTPRPIVGVDGSRGLAEDFPQADRELREVCARLERHYRDMQDVEFTIQHDRLYMLQTRGGKRTGPAAVRIAAELVDEGIITPREAVSRVKPQDLVQVLAPEFDLQEKAKAVADGRLLARGLPAGPGAASGRMVLSAERAAELAAHGPVILVRAETSPEDIVGMHAAAGILTSRGGMTSHAAVVARGMGKPCLVGAGELDVDEKERVVRAGGRVLHEEEEISIDGTTGEVIAGGLATRPSQVLRTLVGTAADAEPRDGAAAEAPEDAGAASPAVATFRKLLGWADELRRMRVRANADTPTDARVARALGAEGIGLCRTEHMFFEEERIPWVRRMILADNDADRAEALAHLLPMQQKDFEGIFAALSGLPVTVRLLDPPLHEFLPHGEKALAGLAKQMGVPAAKVAARAAALAEANPMLGHRGCRLGMTAPEIYEMQVEAITRAACARTRAGDHVEAEIMVPLVGAEQEMIRLRQRIAATVERVLAQEKMQLPISIGTMIEVPRAALIADQIAVHADFFSFGTNDLTQMTYGYSRDDIGRFLPQYLESGVLPYDPFARLDDEGTGQLVRMACERGRQARADLHLGVCGEHGGDPDSIDFFDRVGLDYVSCSPYRVPVARLAAARAAMARQSEAAAGRQPAASQRSTAVKARRRPAAASPARAAVASRSRATAAAARSRTAAAARGTGVPSPTRSAAGRTRPAAPASTRRPARKAASRRSGAVPAKTRGAAARGRSAARKAVSTAAGKASRAASSRAAKPVTRGTAARAAVRQTKKAATVRAARAGAGRAAKAAVGRAAKAPGGRTAKAVTGRSAKAPGGRTARTASAKAAKGAAGRRRSSGGGRASRR